MLWRDRSFACLALGALTSTAASFFLLLVWAAHAFERSGRNLDSASIFAVSWILPVVLARWNSKLLARTSARAVLIAAVLGQAGLALVLPKLSGGGSVVLLGAFALRGGFEGLEKVARLSRLKAVMAHGLLERANSLLSATVYTGIALGAVGSAVAIERLGTERASFVAAALFGLAASIYMASPKAIRQVDEAPGQASHDALADFVETVRDRRLGAPLLAIVMCTALFQGFHNIARTAYGVEYLGLTTSALSYLQMTATAAVILGALFVSRFALSGSRLAAVRPFTWVTVTAVWLQSIVATRSAALGFCLYFGFIFLFEVSFTRIQNILVVACPRERAIGFFAWLHAAVTGTMAASVFVMGAAIDRFGVATAVTGILALCLVAGGWDLSRRMAASAPEGAR